MGVGALGPVFRTYEPTRDRLVAIKVFRLDITPEKAQSLADELSRAAEAGLFHPSIVEPIAAGVEGTVAYRAEEYVAADTLDVAMRHIAPAPIDKALPLITQLAGAIDFARAAGVGHGALHPRDVFVTPDEARATGFGVVDALERVELRAPVRRPYSAPERIDGKPWGTPADVFSLAAIVYELLTGRRASGTGAGLNTPPGTTGGPTDALLAVIARAMDPNPARRYPTALAFAGALEEAADAEPAPTTGAIPAAVPAASASAAAVPPSAKPVGHTPATIEDDITSELEEDEAHHDLTLRERESAEAGAPGPEPGEDPEAEADRLLMNAAIIAGSTQPATGYRSDEFNAPETHVDPEPGLGDADLEHDRAAGPRAGAGARTVSWEADRGRTSVTDPYEYEPAAAVVPAQGSRMLPLAAMLSIGLLVGFAVGYGVGSRSPAGEPPSEGVTSSTQRPAPPAGTDYSEQAVTPPQTAAPQQRPAAPAPAPVPADSPSRAQPVDGSAATTGRILVRSTPAGAGVTVNGRWRGRTPLSLDKLPFGRYAVRVVQPGYAVAREDFTLTGEEASRTLAVKLQRERPSATTARGGTRPAPQGGAARPAPAERNDPESFTGSIYVDSRPRGARVFVDGRAVGTTPLSVPDIPIGSHVVRLELANHRPWTASTRVSAGQQERVTGSLERIE